MRLSSGWSLVPYAGGVLITVDGAIVGVLGISGAALAETDDEVARAAISAHAASDLEKLPTPS